MKVRCCLSVGILSVATLFSSAAFGQGLPQPGPEHQMLKRLEGNWQAVIKGAPEESKATMTCKMGLGGLWLISDFKGELGGAPFEGRGLDGYDPDKKKFVTVWVDSMITAPMNFEGTYDAKTKTLTMHGEGKGPDGKPAKFKNTTEYTDDDHQVFKMSVVGSDGKEELMLTIEYTRKK